jgi:hypothetical protein
MWLYSRAAYTDEVITPFGSEIGGHIPFRRRRLLGLLGLLGFRGFIGWWAEFGLFMLNGWVRPIKLLGFNGLLTEFGLLTLVG